MVRNRKIRQARRRALGHRQQETFQRLVQPRGSTLTPDGGGVLGGGGIS